MKNTIRFVCLLLCLTIISLAFCGCGRKTGPQKAWDSFSEGYNNDDYELMLKILQPKDQKKVKELIDSVEKQLNAIGKSVGAIAGLFGMGGIGDITSVIVENYLIPKFKSEILKSLESEFDGNVSITVLDVKYTNSKKTTAEVTIKCNFEESESMGEYDDEIDVVNMKKISGIWYLDEDLGLDELDASDLDLLGLGSLF